VSMNVATQQVLRIMLNNASVKQALARQSPREKSPRRTVCLIYRASSRATAQDRVLYGVPSRGAARARSGAVTDSTGRCLCLHRGFWEGRPKP
jgi:hypothetical protein